jgi:phytol kinase
MISPDCTGRDKHIGDPITHDSPDGPGQGKGSREERRFPGKAYPSSGPPLPVDERARQVTHIVFGIGIATFILIAGKDRALPVLFGSLLLGFLFSDAIAKGYRIPVISTIVHELERPGVFPGKGAILFLFSSTLCLFFFPAEVAVPAILTLAVLDGVSSLAGQQFGRHRIRNGKSWEGTVAGIIVTAVVLWILVPPPQALAVSLVAGLIELVTPLDDNLVIPPVVCLLLTLFP